MSLKTYRHNVTDFSTELKFDAVPIIRRLKEAKKYAQESLFIHRERKNLNHNYFH